MAPWGGWELWSAFAATTALFAFMPGPALIYTAAQTLARGRRAGFAAAAGIHLGGYAHVLAATLGLSAVFANAPIAYAALKTAGALYLVFIGFRILVARTRSGDDYEAGAAPALLPKTAWRAFVESVVVEVLNPKAALFFLAFLPQFVDPAAATPVWAQFLILGVIVNLSFSLADCVAVLLAAQVVKAARRGRLAERVFRTLGGGALIGLGAHLALSRAR